MSSTPPSRRRRRTPTATAAPTATEPEPTAAAASAAPQSTPDVRGPVPVGTPPAPADVQPGPAAAQPPGLPEVDAPSTPVTAAEAAQQAIEIAAAVEGSTGPVRVPSAYPLDTGLVDYGMWVEMFSRVTPPEPPPGGFQRGRIWA